MRHAFVFTVLIAAASAAPAETSNLLSLEQLLDAYRSEAPDQPDAEVRLDGRIEERPGGGHEVVIVLRPEGETKLNADPGITVTPEPGNGIRWQMALPHRHVDPSIDYFEPSAIVRMPFEGDARQPITVLVEFAYCVVDVQCFFAEEALTVAALD